MSNVISVSRLCVSLESAGRLLAQYDATSRGEYLLVEICRPKVIVHKREKEVSSAQRRFVNGTRY